MQINSNMRCIEILRRYGLLGGCKKINSNMRCIEISNVLYKNVVLSINSNMRCIEIHTAHHTAQNLLKDKQ